MEKKLSYNMVAKFYQEEKDLINALQVFYMIRARRKLTKSETIRLAVLDAAKHLKVGEKIEPPKAPILSSDFSSRLEKTKEAEDGFSSLEDIKKALGLLNKTNNKVASMLKDAGFERKTFRGARGWLVKIKQPTN